MITKFGFMKSVQGKSSFLGLKLALAITVIFFGILLINYLFASSVWLPFILVVVVTLAIDVFSGKSIKRHLIVNFGRALSTAWHWGIGLTFATFALYGMVIMLGEEKATKTSGMMLGLYLMYLILTMIVDAFVTTKAPALATQVSEVAKPNEPT